MKARFGSFAKFLLSSRKEILLVATVAVATLVISSLIAIWLSSYNGFDIPTLGTIRTVNVEAYWDTNLTNKVEAIDWGTIRPGFSSNITVYLRSISNIESTLNQTTGNWTFWNAADEIVAGPSDSTPYMYLTWDYDNSTIQPGEIIRVTLTLHASFSYDFINFLISHDVEKFSVDIQISAS